jgi:hypothetical protein
MKRKLITLTAQHEAQLDELSGKGKASAFIRTIIEKLHAAKLKAESQIGENQ